MSVDIGEKSVTSLHEHVKDSLDVAAVPAVRGKAERRLVWKQDLVILPLLAFAFFFAYVVSDTVAPAFCLFGDRRTVADRLVCLLQDRGQIGNARLMGLQKDLNLSADEYYNTLLVFCE